MKKIFLLFIATLLGLAASPTWSALKVFACEPEWASLANELGGDKLTVFSATTGMQDPHHIQARPSLIAKMRSAQLLICSGAELEIGWLPVLLRKSGNADILPGKPGHFIASDFVTMLDIPKLLDRSEGDVHSSGNPHIHTSPLNIKLVADKLSKRLQQLDHANKKYYVQRYQDFDSRWQAAMIRWQQQLAPLKGKSIVVQHNNWSYLIEWLGLHTLAALEKKPGIPATSAHLTTVLTLLQTQTATMIIYATHQNNKPSLWLANRTNIPAVGLPYTVGGTETTENLFVLFDQTTQRLLEALH